ncbi:MAG: NAD(P)-binding domain-containing protein [Acidobacteria bacterium]|nr:NAD(P)-binding domain-containing protein [Acidobacteriota bacterium]MCA1609309.1 NAD(P)-binding domain-containing protein [Acidobacteriota bacterium]
MPLESDFELLIIGAGPAGIALAAEGRAAGVRPGGILVLERAAEHSWIIRKYYPPSKPVLANYKGIEAKCEGVLCIPDLTREETLTYLDAAIRDSGARVRYQEEVFRIGTEPDGRLRVESTGGVFRARVVVIAIGILGRPARPSYPIPREVKEQVLFDVTGEELSDRDLLVVGGGDTAAEYCQFLVQSGNRVTLSYRGPALSRPNPINRDSVLALERQRRLEVRLSSNVAFLEAADGRVLVRFGEAGWPPLEVDRVIYALGGTTPENFLKSAGIEFDGPQPRLSKSFGTSVPGLFLAGDLTAGRTGGSIILAFNTAAAAMRRICEDHGICDIGGEGGGRSGGETPAD